MPIKHIEFWVSNLQKSLDFYAMLFQILDWRRVDENAFSDGSVKIYFIEKIVQFEENIGPRHICLLAESREVVDQVADFLHNTSTPIIRGPLESMYENRSSYTIDFRDPDEYVLEVATKSMAVKMQNSNVDAHK